MQELGTILVIWWIASWFLPIPTPVPLVTHTVSRVLIGISRGTFRLIYLTQCERRGPGFALLHAGFIIATLFTLASLWSGKRLVGVVLFWCVIATYWGLLHVKRIVFPRRSVQPGRRRR